MQKIHPIDFHVGEKIKQRREDLDITQKQLGAMLGVTFQQVQKYEKAINRVPSSRLYEIGQVLNVSPDFFFEGAEQKHSSQITSLHETNDNDYVAQELENDYTKEEVALLIKSFKQIKDSKLRKKIIEFAVLLANQE